MSQTQRLKHQKKLPLVLIYNQLGIAIFFLFLLVLGGRSFIHLYRFAKEIQLPIYKTEPLSEKICEINASTVSNDDYHLLWYKRLGVNCKDYCEKK